MQFLRKDFILFSIFQIFIQFTLVIIINPPKKISVNKEEDFNYLKKLIPLIYFSE